jgi:mannuronan 5-epimerase
VNLTDIDNQIRNPDILHKETANGVWLLNAGIIVKNDASLYINSMDTSWLKIVAPQGTEAATTTGEDKNEEDNHISKANGIEVFGSLKIDSVKMTSWDPSTNNYAVNEGKRNLKGTKYEVQLGSPRPFISVEGEATGTTDITNSEIAYLGYEGGVGGGPVVGLTYFGGDGSIIANNNIHHLYFAFYSNGITIENNRVSNNTKMGIIFSRNMYDSVARNNIVSDEEQGIVISESHNNEIYNNTVQMAVVE